MEEITNDYVRVDYLDVEQLIKKLRDENYIYAEICDNIELTRNVYIPTENDNLVLCIKYGRRENDSFGFLRLTTIVTNFSELLSGYIGASLVGQTSTINYNNPDDGKVIPTR